MTLTRRHFFMLSSLAVTGCGRSISAQPAKEAEADIVIIGGSTGGVAAAFAACRAGAKKVILTEETDWIGGQLTSQIVPPDEHKWIESTGATQSYRDFRNAVRTIYRTRKDKPLRPELKGIENLNPGNGWVSRLCHEPRVGLAVIEAMLEPFVKSGQLTILLHTVAVSAITTGDAVKVVTVRDREGRETVLAAKYFLDATDEGDLLPLTKTEYRTGSESRRETGEPNAAEEARPGNVQSFNWCYALEYHDGAEHVIDKPKEYDFWKAYPNDGGLPLFNWEKPAFSFYPKADGDPINKKPNFWTYRRIIDAKKFAAGSYPGDVTVVNYHQNDYALGSLHQSTPEQAAKHRDRAKQMSLSLLYWLQTECPRTDDKTGWPGLKPAGDQTGTKDGLAKTPYIRESRRIKSLFTILEQHVSRPLREKEHGKDAGAEVFKDTCGVGHYLYMDLHQTCEGEKKGGWPVFPFQIPVGAIIPERTSNLLAACKNLGVTHLTNGCYRLHPVEWNIGEAAGALAAFCIAKGVTPKGIREKHLADYQKLLTDQGFVLQWAADAVKG